MRSLSRRHFLAGAALAAGPSPLASDPDRPQYHLLPPANWMNDPNAPVYWNGEYHMFYQYNPKAPYWDTMHWGHARSRDLVHWKHLPIAMRPTPDGPDKDGCFTGCMVIDNGKPVIVYTGVKPETVCLATTDDMLDWRKHPRNPVLAAPPAGMDTPGFRDPQVWREGNEWMMLIGAGLRGKGGTLLLYTSRNLVDWTYLHPFLSGKINPAATTKDPVGCGEMWECPDFFPVGDKHLLYLSTEDKVLYWLGDYKDRHFTPVRSGVLVHGPYYAPKSCAGAQGRRVIWGWLREDRSREEQIKSGWSGVMSLPANPSLAPGGILKLSPAPELTMQRRAEFRVQNVDAGTVIRNIAPDCCEVVVQFEPAGASEFGVRRGDQKLIRCADGKITVRKVTADLPLAHHEGARLHLFVDGSVVEVFANGGVNLAARVYQATGDLSLYSESGQARAVTLDAWTLQPISPDRLTS
jgi:beta-fructofuranosidase